MHPLLKAALRALLVLGAIGLGTVIVVNRGGGTDPAGSAEGRVPAAARPTTTSTTAAADPPTTVPDPAPTGADASSSGFVDGSGPTGAVPVTDPPPVTVAPADTGPAPTIPESGTPWLLPVTGAVTVAAVAGVFLWRSRRGRP